MQKLFISIALLLSSLYGLAQTQGINYQAIIIDQEVKELPGVDVEGSALPNKPLTVRFSILNGGGAMVYQEVHTTQTDDYGMINLIIGQGAVTGDSPSIFTEIDWDGAPKDLRVEISLGENTSDFNEFSYQELTFVPYAFHRNITATGNLIVGGKAMFNGETEFQDISVQGQTNLNGGLNVNAGATNLFGDLTVQQNTTLNNTLTVNATTGLNGQVTIDADVNGADNLYNSYPLRVQGSNQGVAIRVDGSRSGSNNFVTFWDAGGIQGRIEGQTTSEVFTSPEYIFDHAIFVLKTVAQVANLVTATAAAVADPGNLIIEGVNSATLAAEIAEYEIFAFTNVGVTYESGSGDYAEWLPRLNPTEEIEFGQVVGVFGGKITKHTEGAELLMVVSRSPIVLGNMPPEEIGTTGCEKVAFMGQVPVWVMGKVAQGDYILPSGANNGVAVARNPDQMNAGDYNKIVGVAWSVANHGGINLINVAVGINANDVSRLVSKQEVQIAQLKEELRLLREQQVQSEETLAALVPGYKEAMQKREPKETHNTVTISADINQQPASGQHPTTVVTRTQVEHAFELIENNMKAQGLDIMKHPVFSKMHTDASFREEMIQRAMELATVQMINK